MTRIKLIAVDMDHTLLTEAGALPPDFGRLVTQLADLDITFAIASGRPHYTLTAMLAPWLDQLTLICDNGGLIDHRRKIIAKHLIAPADYQQLTQFVTTQTTGIPILCGLTEAKIARQDADYLPLLRHFYHRISTVPDLLQETGEVDKFTIYFPTESQQHQDQHRVMRTFQERFSVTISDTMWIDIMTKGTDKAAALTLLGQTLVITSQEMMAFGDSFNDQEMLDYVGYSYLMANGDPAMVPHARFQAPSNEEFGVSQVLRQLIANGGHCPDIASE